MYILLDIYDPLSRFLENLKKVWTGFWNALFGDSCGYVEGYYLISFNFFFVSKRDRFCLFELCELSIIPLSYSLLQTPQFRHIIHSWSWNFRNCELMHLFLCYLLSFLIWKVTIDIFQVTRFVMISLLD